IAPASKRREPHGVWDHAPSGLRFDRVRFESMRSDKDEVFRFIWENREKLEVRDGAYTEVLNVWPCTRVGPDGFTLHETVAQYYQAARLTPLELKARKIELPPEYVAALERERRKAGRRGKPGRGGRDDANADAAENDDDAPDPTTPIYGGGVLIFDEFG